MSQGENREQIKADIQGAFRCKALVGDDQARIDSDDKQAAPSIGNGAECPDEKSVWPSADHDIWAWIRYRFERVE